MAAMPNLSSAVLLAQTMSVWIPSLREPAELQKAPRGWGGAPEYALSSAAAVFVPVAAAAASDAG